MGSGLAHDGLFHLAAPDRASWWEVADWALRLDGTRGDVSLRPVATDMDDTAANHPVDLSLSSDRFADCYGVRLQPWRKAMSDLWPELSRRPANAVPVGPGNRQL